MFSCRHKSYVGDAFRLAQAVGELDKLRLIREPPANELNLRRKIAQVLEIAAPR